MKMKLINRVILTASKWRTWLKLIVVIEIVVISTNLIPYKPTKFNIVRFLQSAVGLKRTKSILIWNSAHRIETSAFGTGSEPFVTHKCPVSDCQVVDNTTDLPFDEFDAVIFHIHEMEVTKLPEEVNCTRSRYQRFIMLTQESPLSMTTFNRTLFANYFNWTMSYRLDSDIHLLYGRVTAKATAPRNSSQVQRLIQSTRSWNRNYAANKTKTVAWMVSHCPTYSLRENYVNELRKHIQVDVYGKCGNLTCARNATHWLSDPQCYDLLASQYKFYLSFENSLCTDYVTEKFFEILAHDMVPIVYGAANYSALAPPHSFIHALAFTPRELAAYLYRLDADDLLYNEFFWWKDHYIVESGVEQMARHGFCDLCEKLHKDQQTKIYPEMQSQWSSLNTCIDLSASPVNLTSNSTVSLNRTI